MWVYTTNVDGDQDSDVALNQAVAVDDVKVKYFASKTLRRLYYATELKTRLKKDISEFDIVHLHSVFLWPTAKAASICRQTNTPYVLSPRGMLNKDLVREKSRIIKTGWIELIERNNIRHASALHLTADAEKQALAPFKFDIQKVIMLANGTRQPQYEANATLSEDIAEAMDRGSYCLYFGRLNWKKRILDLIDSWRNEFDFNLLIAGNDDEGYTDSILQRIGEQQLRNVYVISRQINGQDKEHLISHAKLFLLISHSENFGNTVIEAMIRKVPVMVNHAVGAAEIVSSCNGGWVVEDENFAAELRRVLSNSNELDRRGQNGSEYIRSQFSWTIIAEKMVAAYQDILRTK